MWEGDVWRDLRPAADGGALGCPAPERSRGPSRCSHPRRGGGGGEGCATRMAPPLIYPVGAVGGGGGAQKCGRINSDRTLPTHFLHPFCRIWNSFFWRVGWFDKAAP